MNRSLRLLVPALFVVAAMASAPGTGQSTDATQPSYTYFFDPLTYVVSEADGNASVNVFRNAGGQPSSVRILSEAGTATADVDYETVDVTLAFLANETAKTLRVRLMDDQVQEGNETFELVLQNGDASASPTQRAFVKITDNDTGSTSSTPSPTASPSATLAPGPTPSAPALRPNENYTYELVDQTIRQDVLVKGAKKVVLRNTIVQGNVTILLSSDVTLENVDVSGDVVLQAADAVLLRGLDAGGRLGLDTVHDAEVRESRFLGDLACLRCGDVILRNVQVGGEVTIRDSVRVFQENVKSHQNVAFQPLPAAAPTGVRLDVDDNQIQIVQPEAGLDDAQRIGDLRLNVDAQAARTRLAFALPEEPDRVLVELDSRFEKLREFEDQNGDGGYDLGDLVVREHLLGDLPISALRQERLDGDQAGWRIRVEYALPDGGTFALIYTARDGEPDQTKIDVEIHDYPYANPESRLALQIRIETPSDWRIETGEAEDRLVFAGQGYDGFFAWIHTAQVDGVDTRVTAQVLEGHRAGNVRDVVLYLGYARGDRIVHDPSVGVVAASALAVFTAPELGNLLVYGSTLVAALIVLWAMGSSSRRPK